MAVSSVLKHLNLWKEGKTDLSITRFSSIVKRLKEQGVNVYFPYPGQQYVQNVCERLLSDIEKRELEERQPCVIVVRLLGQENSVSYLRELDSNYIRLESMMMEVVLFLYATFNISSRSNVDRKRFALLFVTPNLNASSCAVISFSADAMRQN